MQYMKHLLLVDFVLTHVKMPSGITLTLEMEITAYIKNIKTKIEIKEEIRADQQRLIFYGKELLDCHTIFDCGIKNESTLHLECKHLSYIATICIVQNSTSHQVQYVIYT